VSTPLGGVDIHGASIRWPLGAGPHIGVERLIGPADGNLTREPMMAAWSRPFRENVGNRAAITPVGELLTSGGMLFRGHHVWLGKFKTLPLENASDATGGAVPLLGLPALRLAGFYSLANSEFSTHVFTMPGKSLWVNADAHWMVPPHTPLDKDGLPITCDEGCAAYVMVALHDGLSGALVPGYEKEGCVFTHVDGTRLPLRWGGRTGSALAGKTVFLRVYYRDATIYAIGHDADDDSLYM
jgi:hypothetical protein